MNRRPRTLRLEQTVHDAIVLIADGRYRNVPIVDDDGRVVGHRPPAGPPEVPRRGVPRGAAQPAAPAAPADDGVRGRVTTTRERDAGRPGPRSGHDPVRRRLRRRDAAHRHPVHPDRRRLRQRHQHAARLPGRDPRAGRLAAGRVRLPDQLLELATSTPRATQPDVLVAMNPAALKANLGDLPAGGALIVNEDAFTRAEPPEGRLRRQPAGRRLARRRTRSSRSRSPPSTRGRSRVSSMTTQADRPDEELLRPRPHVLALRAEHGPDAPLDRREVRQAAGDRRGERPGAQGRLRLRRDDRDLPHPLPRRRRPTSPPGTYRNITGNEATALGFVAAAQKADRALFYGSYPITPASDILHQLSGYKNFGVKTFQAEDEIAAIGSAIGASYGGALGMTGTSGPGIALKSEAMNLAVMVELPLVVVDVQRAGPSTGMPTKTEQADLLQVLFGRNGDSPIAGRRAGHARRVLRHGLRGRPARAPVHDPGRLPVGRLPGDRRGAVAPARRRRRCPTSGVPNRTERAGFQPYDRDPVTLARPWAVPGHARARAPDRRPREGRHHRQRQLRPGQPPPDADPPGREDRPDRRRHPRARGLRAGRGRPARSSAGARPTAPSGAPSSGSRARVAASPTPISATSTRSRATPATSSAATAGC